MIWKVLQSIGYLSLLMLAASMFLARGKSQRPAKVIDDRRVAFPSSHLVFWGWILFEIRWISLSVYYFQRSEGQVWNLVTAVLIALSAIALVFSLPGTVVVSDEGVEEHRWFRKNKKIAWDDITEIVAGEKSFTVTVNGSDSTKIIYTNLLADRPRFLFELKKHCGEDLPPEFPREPISEE